MKNISIVILSILLISSCTSTPTEEDIKDGFKKFATEYIDSYKTDKRQRVTELGGGWAKEEYTMVESSYDIQSTNSLVSPYVGICKFTLQRNYTDFFETKDAASNSNKFIASDTRIHIHKYLYQDGKWNVSERTHNTIDKWYDCNEIIEEGGNNGNSNIFGCWEKNL